jgi:hypothetical protein
MRARVARSRAIGACVARDGLDRVRHRRIAARLEAAEALLKAAPFE